MNVSECLECGQTVSSNADTCPHCGSPIPTESAIQRVYSELLKEFESSLGTDPTYSSMSEAQIEEELREWVEERLNSADAPPRIADYRDLEKMRTGTRFHALLEYAGNRFPSNDYITGLREWGWELIWLKGTLTWDLPEGVYYFTDAYLRELSETYATDVYGFTEGLGLSEQQCEHIGLKRLELKELLSSDSIEWTNLALGRYVYCMAGKASDVHAFFAAYDRLTVHDQEDSGVGDPAVAAAATLARDIENGLESVLSMKPVTDALADVVNKESPRGSTGTAPDVSQSLDALRSLAEQQGWDYVVRDGEGTFVILKDMYLLVRKDYSSWTLHLGDLAGIESASELRSQAAKQYLPHFEFEASSQSPDYAKSALVGGVIAGPVGAIVGAGYAADRPHKQKSRLVAKEFERTITHRNTEVRFADRFGVFTELTLDLTDLHDAPRRINDRDLEDFLEMLRARIPLAQGIRDAEFAWVTRHGSTEGMNRDSSEFIAVAAELDPNLSEQLARLAEDKRRVEKSRIEEERRAEAARVEEARHAEEARARRKWRRINLALAAVVVVLAASVGGYLLQLRTEHTDAVALFQSAQYEEAFEAFRALPGGFMDVDRYIEMADVGLAVSADGTILEYVGGAEEVIIPASVGDVRITAIGRGAFKYQTQLTRVVIPEGVTSIGEEAFLYCTGLREINIPDGVSILEAGAFSGTDLRELTIPPSVQEIKPTTLFWSGNLNLRLPRKWEGQLEVLPPNIGSVEYY